MLITTLDGEQQRWNPKSSVISFLGSEEDSHKSSIHIKARKLLRKVFNSCLILEEAFIPIAKYKHLFLDFYIPLRKLAIEVQGIQHTKYNSFFHNTKLDFIQQQKNDKDKRQWCELNKIGLIELLYNESQEEWKTKINNFL